MLKSEILTLDSSLKVQKCRKIPMIYQNVLYRKNLMLEKLEILISGSLGLFTWFISGSLVFENFPVFNNSNKIFRIEF